MKVQAVRIAIIVLFLLSTYSTAVHGFQTTAGQADLLHSDGRTVSIRFNGSLSPRVFDPADPYTAGRDAPGEGEPPLYPYMSRMVVVPPDLNLRLDTTPGTPVFIPCETPPAWYTNRNIIPVSGRDACQQTDTDIYPPEITTLESPVLFRGVRMTRLSSYPLQYDPQNSRLIYYPEITATITACEGTAENRSTQPLRAGRSKQSLAFLSALTANGDALDQWYTSGKPSLTNSYLMVIHEKLITATAPFIEWRRQCGDHVEILPIPVEACRDTIQIKALIQSRYDEQLDKGIDPYDHMLLVGDRRIYFGQYGAYHILEAPAGKSVEFMICNHADYLYGCLEGNDQFPDVAVTRWPVGQDVFVYPAVQRTLRYSATPYMEDASWFTRGGVFSQHWGNSSDLGWHISIHTVPRWGYELLLKKGFQDLYYYEDTEWDQYANRIGPVIAQLMNRNANLIIGRMENYYFRDSLRGVDNRNVFPIYLSASGHGETAVEQLFRVAGWQVKGMVAGSCFWGNPTTTSTNAVWMEMVNAFVSRDMTLGWSRLLATTVIQNYIPNIEVRNKKPLHDHVLADFDVWGDPGLRPWLCVPHKIRAKFPAKIKSGRQQIEVVLTEETGLHRLDGALVTLYAPGGMPAFDSPEYPAYNRQKSWSALSDKNGRAILNLTEDDNLVKGGKVYLTVTGGDVIPFRDSLLVEEPAMQMEILDYTIEPVNQNGPNTGLLIPGGSYTAKFRSKLSGIPYLTTPSFSATTTTSTVQVHSCQTHTQLDGCRNEQVELTITVEFSLDNCCRDGSLHPATKPLLMITGSAGTSSTSAGIALDPYASEILFDRIVSTNRHSVDFKETGIPFIVSIKNSGRLDYSEHTAKLYSYSPYVKVVTQTSNYPRIWSGNRAGNNSSPFHIEIKPNCPPAYRNEFHLVLDKNGVAEDTVRFSHTFGDETANIPLGPDSYGYFCWDDTDTVWREAPKYRWFEISPQEMEIHARGLKCEFANKIFNNGNAGATVTVPIGFITRFYGNDYDKLTICSNGFVAVGDQRQITNFQNMPMDRAIGAGVGTIAPYWDKLKFGDRSQVYYHTDLQKGMFIVEWYRMQAYYDAQAELTFQLILYDKERYHTPTGDQPILFQYKQITCPENVSPGERWSDDIPYASVGISSPDSKSALSYVYNNSYPLSSAPLQNRRALRFQPPIVNEMCSLTGSVVENANDRVVAGAGVYVNGRFRTTSREDGTWSVDSLPAFTNLQVEIRNEGLLPATFFIPPQQPTDEVECHIRLLKPRLNADIRNVSDYLLPDEVKIRNLTLSNSGDGTGEWRVVKSNLSGDTLPQWSEQGKIDLKIDQPTGGVTFANNLFYTAVNQTHQSGYSILALHSPDGFDLGSYAQSNLSSAGYDDLTFDGNYLWALDKEMIYKITSDGTITASFPAPEQGLTALAYDNSNQILWVCGSGKANRLYGMSRDGSLKFSLPFNGLQVISAAYYPDDSDNCPLWVLYRSNALYTLEKVNPFQATRRTVHSWIQPLGETVVGFDITDQIKRTEIWLVTLVRTANSNRLDYNLVNYCTNWFTVTPSEGAVAPGGKQTVELTLNRRNSKPGVLQGELTIVCTASREETRIPVTLSVMLDSHRDQRELLPDQPALLDSYPNPFNSSTTIRYYLPASWEGSIALFDLQGRMLEQTTGLTGCDGVSTFVWSAGNRPAGIYFVRLSTNGHTSTRKLLLLK